MNKKNIFQICHAILLVLFIGCTKEITEEQVGNLRGNVVAISYQNYSATVMDNAKIKLQSGDYIVEVATDINGDFELNNIPIGTYNLIYQKEGYGTYIDYGVQIFGGIIPLQLNSISLYELTDGKMDIQNIETIGYKSSYNSRLEIRFDYQRKETNSTMFLLLFSKENNIDLQHYEVSYIIGSYFESGTVYMSADYDEFPENSKWYVKIYPVLNEYYYLDPETGKEVYYSANAEVSTSASFTINEATNY